MDSFVFLPYQSYDWPLVWRNSIYLLISISACHEGYKKYMLGIKLSNVKNNMVLQLMFNECGLFYEKKSDHAFLKSFCFF